MRLNKYLGGALVAGLVYSSAATAQFVVKPQTVNAAPVARIIALKGNVSVQEDGEKRSAEKNDLLAENAIIDVLEKSEVQVRYGDEETGCTVTHTENTRAVVKKDKPCAMGVAMIEGAVGGEVIAGLLPTISGNTLVGVGFGTVGLLSITGDSAMTPQVPQ